MNRFELLSPFGVLYSRENGVIGKFLIEHISSAIEKGFVFPRCFFKLTHLYNDFFWPKNLTLYSRYGSTYIIPNQKIFHKGLAEEILSQRYLIGSEKVQFIKNADRVIYESQKNIFLEIWIVNNKIEGFTLEHYGYDPSIDVRWKAEDRVLRCYVDNHYGKTIYPASTLQSQIQREVPNEVFYQAKELLKNEPEIAEQFEQIINER